MYGCLVPHHWLDIETEEQPNVLCRLGAGAGGGPATLVVGSVVIESRGSRKTTVEIRFKNKGAQLCAKQQREGK